MAEVQFTVLAADHADFEYTMREIASKYPSVTDVRSTSSSSTDAAHVMRERDRLRDEVSALKRESGNAHADALQASYADGVKDGKSEANTEKLYSGNNALYAMLGHDTVQVCMEPGRAPFEFKPQYVTTFCKLPTIDGVTADDVPNYQRELIGTPAHTVGIYGTNMVTKRPMFIVRVDHWTLTT